MKGIEIEAPSVAEAIELALARLDKKREEVEVTVLRRGRRGILGFGAQMARVLVTPHILSSEEVAQVAREALTRLLVAMGVEAQVSVYDSIMEPRQAKDRPAITLDVASEDAALLIGRRCRTLDALQLITRLIVSQRLHRRVEVNVDVDGYRARRRRSLRQLAAQTADRVRYSGEPISLEPMPAHERRVIHRALQSDPDVTTESIDKDEARRIVILPRRLRKEVSYAR